MRISANDVLIVFGEVNDIETLDETMNPFVMDSPREETFSLTFFPDRDIFFTGETKNDSQPVCGFLKRAGISQGNA